MDEESFVYWLVNNRDVISYSVNRYTNAIDTVSSELEEDKPNFRSSLNNRKIWSRNP